MVERISAAEYELDVVCGGDGFIKKRALRVRWLSPDRVQVQEREPTGPAVIVKPGVDRQLGATGFWVSYESIAAATNAAEEAGVAPRLEAAQRKEV